MRLFTFYLFILLIMLFVLFSCNKNNNKNEDDGESSGIKVMASLAYEDMNKDFMLSGRKGAYTFLAKGDLNNYQKDDIVFGHFALDGDCHVNISSKLAFFINSETHFAVNTNIFETIPQRVMPRYGLIGDYNGDGKNDLFSISKLIKLSFNETKNCSKILKKYRLIEY